MRSHSSIRIYSVGSKHQWQYIGPHGTIVLESEAFASRAGARRSAKTLFGDLV